MNEKYQEFNGLKFTRDDKSGYYLNSTIRKRMHRYVWEFFNGPIPKGYSIHHKDGNKGNNQIDNLELLTTEEHVRRHSKEWHKKHPGAGAANLNKAREKANDWHKSEAGREWHKEHSPKAVFFIAKCEECGKEYNARTSTKMPRFCSNACKARNRRKEGKDLITEQCAFCNKSFKTNKYKKSMCCSKSCANKMRRFSNVQIHISSRIV